MAAHFLKQAGYYETKYADELHRRLMVEHSQRRQKTALKMATRFTGIG